MTTPPVSSSVSIGSSVLKRDVSAWRWWATYLRLFAVQGSWNYETMLGNGIAFCSQPLLRALPEAQQRLALAHQAKYFNCHPYLAGVAVGAIARAELDGEDPVKIERFRTALCGPLGSVGDQLIWAGWLPLSSIIALGTFGLGAAPLAVLGIFLGLYNAGHFALRAWGLRVGLRHGIRVAPSLASPILRQGPQWISRGAALLAGVAIPLALHRALGPGNDLAGLVVVAAMIGAALLAVLHGRAQGWRIALGLLALFVLYSVVQ